MSSFGNHSPEAILDMVSKGDLAHSGCLKSTRYQNYLETLKVKRHNDKIRRMRNKKKDLNEVTESALCYFMQTGNEAIANVAPNIETPTMFSMK